MKQCRECGLSKPLAVFVTGRRVCKWCRRLQLNARIALERYWLEKKAVG